MANGGLEYLPAFAISLAIGLLIGLERERTPTAKAGLRTFTLVALFGTLAALLSEQTGAAWVLTGGLLVVGGMMVAAYARVPDAGGDPGTTTVAAIVLCYGLGAMVWYGYHQLAVMLAIVITVLLYFKTELHDITKSLTRRDLISFLQFALLSLVILPLLPNQNYGPYQALNPYQIWWMVVLISGVSLAGYAALRIAGQRHGAPLMGLFGGLVSSTATTLVFSRHARNNGELVPIAAVVILLANLMVLVRLGVIAAVVSPRLLPALLPVLGGGLLAGLAGTGPVLARPAQRCRVARPGTQQPHRDTHRAGFRPALRGGAVRRRLAGRLRGQPRPVRRGAGVRPRRRGSNHPLQPAPV